MESTARVDLAGTGSRRSRTALAPRPRLLATTNPESDLLGVGYADAQGGGGARRDPDAFADPARRRRAGRALPSWRLTAVVGQGCNYSTGFHKRTVDPAGPGG